MAVKFDFASALEGELERQLLALRAMILAEDFQSEQLITEAVVDMTSLLLAYTTIAESGISPLDPSKELNRLVDMRMTGFSNRFLREESGSEFDGDRGSNQQEIVLTDWHKDLCEIADLIRALQVILHLPEHIGRHDA